MAQSCTLWPEATKVRCGKQTSDGLTPGTGSHYRLLCPEQYHSCCATMNFHPSCTCVIQPWVAGGLLDHEFLFKNCFKLVILVPQIKCSLSSWFFSPFCSLLLSSRRDIIVFVVLMWGESFSVCSSLWTQLLPIRAGGWCWESNLPHLIIFHFYSFVTPR